LNVFLEARAFRHADWREGLIGAFVADVFYEAQNDDVIFVLGRIHAAQEMHVEACVGIHGTRAEAHVGMGPSFCRIPLATIFNAPSASGL
jgi:hypothetical protein